MAGVMGSLFFHIMCCLTPVIFKCAYAAGMNFDAASALTNQVGMYVCIPFFAYGLATDLSVSIAWVYFTLKGRLGLSRWAALCCPVVTLILGQLFHLLPWPVGEIGVAFETMRYVLLMAMGLRLCETPK